MTQQLVFEEIETARKTLSDHGLVFESTGSFQTSGEAVSIHTCIGPLQSGKTVNQDAALAVRFDDSFHIKWACALADGVSTSLLSEVGSRVATWTALAALVASPKWIRSHSRALKAFEATQAAISELGTKLKTDLGELRYKPSYLPAPAYRHVVNRQTCFQTTLCLVWLDRTSIHIASVGDSGALLYSDAKRCKELFFPDLSVSRVNAICPTINTVRLDQYLTVPASSSQLAVFTDGVAKGLAERFENQVPLGFDFPQAFPNERAEDCLSELAASTSEEAADNMTLLIVRQD